MEELNEEKMMETEGGTGNKRLYDVYFRNNNHYVLQYLGSEKNVELYVTRVWINGKCEEIQQYVGTKKEWRWEEFGFSHKLEIKKRATDNKFDIIRKSTMLSAIKFKMVTKDSKGTIKNLGEVCYSFKNNGFISSGFSRGS